VSKIESRCRITGVENPVDLVASHCKPWRDSTNEERLNGENGLLMTPSIDHLFDRGFIGFEDNGKLISLQLLTDPLSNEWASIPQGPADGMGHATDPRGYSDDEVRNGWMN